MSSLQEGCDLNMKLGECSGIRIKITTDDGKVFEGIGEYYTSSLDNPDGIASICIGDYELYENEISNIEILSDTDSAQITIVPDMQVAV